MVAHDLDQLRRSLASMTGCLIHLGALLQQDAAVLAPTSQPKRRRKRGQRALEDSPHGNLALQLGQPMRC